MSDENSADDTDPFEEIDVEDRDADPFEEIQPGEQSREGEPPDDQFPGKAERDFEESSEDFSFGPEGDTDSDQSPGPTSPDEGDATNEGGDPFDQMGSDKRSEDPFEQMGRRPEGEPPEMDEELWENLSPETQGPETKKQGQRRLAEVSKHSYCEQCEYFSNPPDISCSHEGTDILEFIDFETVRLADCPIVKERKQLARKHE